MKDFRLSEYNFYHQEKANLRVLNCASRTVVEFPNADKSTLMTRISTLPEEQIQYLKENQVLIHSGCNEYETYLRNFYDACVCDDTITVTIGFTFRCNFNCSYCIQKENYQVRHSLSLEDINSIIDWLHGSLSDKTKRININYFGGEPTLNMEAVLYFAKQLNNLCSKASITSYYQMVTNGYALTDYNIDKLLALGIRDFQITLDGLKDTHNERRSKTFDSFTEIVDNIIKLSDRQATINLLHVYDVSNINSSLELVDYFFELSKANPSLRSNLVFNFAPMIPKMANEATCNKHVVGKELFLSEKGVEAFTYAARKGFRYVNFLNVDRCFRQVKNSVLIAPDLKLYKCYSTFGRDEYAVCDLSTPYPAYVRKSEAYSQANGFSTICEDCSVAPLCRGGCQFAASEQNNGKYGLPYCEKETISSYIHGFLANGLY